MSTFIPFRSSFDRSWKFWYGITDITCLTLKQLSCMKKTMFFILLLMSAFLPAQSSQELFLQGNKHFFNGQFDKARQCYEEIPEKNSVIWHNIGNCYYNENKCSKALVCWRRAQTGASFQQIGQLLDLEKIVLEKYHFPCDGIFMKSLKQIILSVPKLLLQFLLLLCFLFFFFLFYKCYLQKGQKTSRLLCKKRYFISLLLTTVVFMLLLGAKAKFMKEKQGVVTTQKVAVYVGPETTFHQKITLPESCIVQILDEKPGMFKVVCSEGAGWITSDAVEIV